MHRRQPQPFRPVMGPSKRLIRVRWGIFFAVVAVLFFTALPAGFYWYGAKKLNECGCHQEPVDNNDYPTDGYYSAVEILGFVSSFPGFINDADMAIQLADAQCYALYQKQCNVLRKSAVERSLSIQLNQNYQQTMESYADILDSAQQKRMIDSMHAAYKREVEWHIDTADVPVDMNLGLPLCERWNRFNEYYKQKNGPWIRICYFCN